MKKIFKMSLVIITIIILIIIIILLINLILSLEDNRILKGYYKKEDYSRPHYNKDYADYYKYYYNEKSDVDFQNSKMYRQVENADIEEIKLYFENFKEIMNSCEGIRYYDFNESIIDENDYFIVNNKVDMNERLKRKKFCYYDVLLYDTDSHTLYVIYVNT